MDGARDVHDGTGPPDDVFLVLSVFVHVSYKTPSEEGDGALDNLKLRRYGADELAVRLDEHPIL